MKPATVTGTPVHAVMSLGVLRNPDSTPASAVALLRPISPLDNSTLIGSRHTNPTQSRPGTDHVLLTAPSIRAFV